MKKILIIIITLFSLITLSSCVDRTETFEVTFKGYNEEVLKIENVQYNKKATAPTPPKIKGYTFLKWNTKFDKVRKDLTVSANYQINRHKTNINAMGTTISIDFYGGEDEDLDYLIDLFLFYTQISSNFKRNEFSYHSPYYDMSNVFLINDKRGIEPVKVNDELFELIKYSLLLIEDTNGYFNPLIGNAVDIWKEVIDKYNKGTISKEVYDETINKLSELEEVDLSKIVLDEENKTIYIKDKTLVLDIGAVAKGFVTNLAVNYLKEKEIKYYMVDSGRSNIGVGTHIEDRPYRIGNKDPNGVYKDGRLGILRKYDTHIVTSGYEEHYVEYDSNIYHHIISPFDNIPKDHFLSVVLVGDDAGLLDAYSTAVYSMSVDYAIAFLEEKEIKYLLYIKENNEIITNLSKDEYEVSKKK